MAKRHALKQKLKAAEQRRRRRLEAPGEHPPSEHGTHPSTAPSVDVTGLVVEAIVQHAHSLGNEARDIIAVAALNSVFRGTTPQGDEARGLAETLQQIPARENVSTRAFRDTVEQLLQVAKANHNPRQGNAFLCYLEMLAE